MKTTHWTFAAVISAAALAGCTNNPTNPSVSFTSPLAAGPATGTSYRFKDQPVTVVIANAVRTSDAAVTYSVEVARDPSFSQIVLTRDGLEEGSGSTTSLTLPALEASTGDVTYYWRSRATVDGVAGPASAPEAFVIQQQIVIQTPTAVTPAGGETTTDARPTFVVKNAVRQGAVGAVTYIFQVSKTSDFSSLLFDVPVPEGGGGQTTWTPPSDLPSGAVYWRVRARDDANAEASGFTAALTVVVEPFDPKKAIFWNNPPDVGFWPETARITSIDFSTGHMLVDFDRRTGPNAWPESASAAFGPIQYTLGMCFRFDAEWHCSAPTRFWVGRPLDASGAADRIADFWYYDPARWGPMAGHQPAQGELVAFWVGQGNLRAGTIATNEERSNFVLVRFGENYQAP